MNPERFAELYRLSAPMGVINFEGVSMARAAVMFLPFTLAIKLLSYMAMVQLQRTPPSDSEKLPE